jgi:hypothetical protein
MSAYECVYECVRVSTSAYKGHLDLAEEDPPWCTEVQHWRERGTSWAKLVGIPGYPTSTNYSDDRMRCEDTLILEYDIFVQGYTPQNPPK